MEEKKLTLSEFRKRVGDSSDVWRSLEELSRGDQFEDFVRDEFPRQALALDLGLDRRDFVKLMSASMAMAGLAACTQPARELVPYVNQPENLIPGKPVYFASAMADRGYARGVLVESHMNRPTKIEGNPDHPASLGASDVHMQASILGLYDPERSQVVRHIGEISTWSEFIGALQPVLGAAKTNGAGLRILTQTITSPTLTSQIQQVLATYPGARWHQWEAAGNDNAREGARLAFGGYINPIYHFDKANVVVSLASDFTAHGPAHLRHARDFMTRRRVRRGTTSMNRLYVIESMPSQTGGVADHRFPVKPSEIEGIARALLASFAGGQAPSPVPGWVPAIAKDLLANRGTSIVIAGDEQPPVVHQLAHAMNQILGNNGTTVTFTDPVESEPVNQLESLRQLVIDMNAGRVKALVIVGGNPAFDAPADLRFREAFDKVPFRAHLSSHYDETSFDAHWHIPETHYLETWSDARAYDGTVSIMQPLIAPLYNGRSAHELMGALIGGLDASPYETVHNYWLAKGANDNSWRKWLNDGVIAGSALPQRTATASTTIPAPAAQRPEAGIEIELRPDPNILDGRYANNAWLQELPKPMTKICWENVVLVGLQTARQIGYDDDDRESLVNEKRTRLVDVEYRGVTLRMPIWVLPGHAEGAATIFYGFGRTRGGAVASEKGKGFPTYAYRFSNALSGGRGARITMSGESPYTIACVQEHQSLNPIDLGGGDRRIIRNATFEEFRRNPDFARQEEKAAGEEPGAATEQYEGQMYPAWDYSKQNAWGMVIDTSVCTGCNGCVQACQAENNIAVVGKEEIVREREMHWLRLDRYYKGDPENPATYHMPVPCMQCETAPCEPVCPVGATTHSAEGLNDMTYNRCVGTRYCSNNCPYKVRRFNFFQYSDYFTAALKPMRNPDVTVRTRGVMEKCTYCVQRINAARMEAEKTNRPIRDGEFTTACAQACPTEAIVFGNLLDPKSRVANLKNEPTNYTLLEELNTRPRTTYLATVRNPNPEIR